MTNSRNADLLVELGCEELPPKALALLAKSFFDGTCAGLESAGLEFDKESSRYLYTPRRMTLLLSAVQSQQPDRQIERKGPSLAAAFDADGNPTRAASGFAASVGRPVDQLETLKTDKGEWLYCLLDVPGKSLSEVLYPVLQTALDQLPVPKPMRWSDHSFSFVRPVHWLLVLHGDQVLEGSLYGCDAGRQTRGHRIHSPGPHEISHTSEYQESLKSAFVVVDQDERKSSIQATASEAGNRDGGETRITDALLDEVTNLVEWPVAVACEFEPVFLDVPSEALIASMEAHQKFFPVLNAQTNELQSAFVVMANLESKDVQAVREGFERVVRPRLADARFFWQQDLKTPLEASLPALDNVVFQEKLGSIGDKCRRIEGISKDLAEIAGIEGESAARAARLCKCDLVSLMVGEFPELQGIMGGYYAIAAGESESVSTAITEHYQPRFSGDSIPESSAGQLVALADRLDTLVGIFAAGLKPTGNKDPFALRRAVLGIIRILQGGGFDIRIDAMLEVARKHLQTRIDVGDEVLASVREFFVERLRNYLIDTESHAGAVRAVLAAPLGTIADVVARVEAVSAFMQQADSASLVAANKRIGNILKKNDRALSERVEVRLIQMEAETKLFEAVSDIKGRQDELLARHDYRAVLASLAGLKEPVDEYFDHVMVMDEDLEVRDNRLAQLAELKHLFDQVADFSMAD